MTALTDKQVENWRAVLCQMFGPYALIMSAQDIQRIHDKFQADIDALPQEPEYCECDTKKHGYTRHQDDTVTCNHCQKPRRQP